MAAPTNLNKGQKRKEAPQSSSSSNQKTPKGRDPKRAKIYDARIPIAQNADAALKNGELDLQSFLKAREFEIKALEDGQQKAKGGLSTRAFQQVPRDMRRRTASHNVKRVPKRLLKRAKKEMKDDNTPTVDPSKRKPGTTRNRLRAETAKRLGILAAKKRAQKAKAKDGTTTCTVETRAARPKIRKNMLNEPPKPKSKFRKRQIHKTWLPTHMWHAKRARMTEPKKPLWRFAIPTTSTEKSYRPTHRATGARGAVAWDMSYMSTIRLEGSNSNIKRILQSVGLDVDTLWNEHGEKWRNGKRAWSGWLTRKPAGEVVQIGPSTVVWCAREVESDTAIVFVRVHPSIFLETWEELLRLSKLQHPKVHLEDLRFEIGSIEITGPGSTETLLGILHPYNSSTDSPEEHGETFKSLAGLSNPGTLPANVILAFPIMDPRLRYPSRRVALPNPDDEEANCALLETLSSWPLDASTPSRALFDRNARFKATRLPAQKSINRRKAKELPGAYPTVLPTDPEIPIMLLASRSSSRSAQGTWTLLAPWKCILPIWYGLVHHPLTSGGNPRFGGLEELQQVHFEHRKPWFPADYPGTAAGFAWEAEQREIRKEEWDRRPKGKRVEWDSLDLGAGRKGEIGRGWACDFERLVGLPTVPSSTGDTTQSTTQDTTDAMLIDGPENAPKKTEVEKPIIHISPKHFTTLLSTPSADLPPLSQVATIRLTLTTRGIASPCARIYRLPPPISPDDSTQSANPPTTREAWLATLPPPSTSSKRTPNSKGQKPPRIPLNCPVPLRTRLLAQSLLHDPPLAYPGEKVEDHPLVPDEEDLIGFVTTGEFNLSEGKGIAIGSVCVKRAIEGLRKEGNGKGGRQRLCIVRNAGESIGRLASWEVV
ncbi:hypothetical protein HYFRA_00010072 [Hymenoscyphus fraxineus]|uniref:POPLD-domain-containing protein n=1 Tax=Hymenoscyphus fraxineus TaxID=746836 RepID=A0A9N9KVF8_9HELO|nr:hypothetical protein HYFRA_00010072 [Hymenoscyphus fraxineus]